MGREGGSEREDVNEEERERERERVGERGKMVWLTQEIHLVIASVNLRL